jgi:lipoprotein-anchoring transpeptidase ErfK/SrfK
MTLKVRIRINVYLLEQRLTLSEGQKIVLETSVSLAKNGLGEQIGSECTPRGWHQIRAKIGAGCPVNTIFKGRRPTGEIYTPELGRTYPDRDWILTRILWLSGLEPGKNRFGNVDTMRRYIYIHGAPDEVPMGIPGSRGCIRMHNEPLLELFERAKLGTQILLAESMP